MPWPVLFFSISVFGLTIASYTDLRERIVSDKLSYSLIAFGLAGHLAWALSEARPRLLFNSTIAALTAFLFGYALWRVGVWAGGDVKLFTGIAALNPINPALLAWLTPLKEIAVPVELPVFPFTLFVFSALAMLPYGCVIAVHGLLKKENERERKKLVKETMGRAWQTLQLSAAIVGLSWFFSSLEPTWATQWLVVPALLALGMLKNREARIVLISAVFVASSIQQPFKQALSLSLTFAFIFALYLLLRLYFLSKRVLREKKKALELREGDIIAETLVEANGEVKRIRELEIKRIINYFVNNRLRDLVNYLNPKGRVIASGRRARGLSVEEIKELQRLVKERKLRDCFEVKLSAPLVPAMFAAYVALNFVGDALWAAVL